MSRAFAAIASIALCGAALEPLVRSPDDDGFPLSTYPMFAVPRPAELAMVRALGARRDGGLGPLSPDHLGTGEVMQAFVTLQRAAGADPAERAALCDAIAARVAGDTGYRDVIEIRIVIGTYGAAALAHPGAPLPGEDVLARCGVARGQR